jgi:peptidoglycan/LPS O-acetylase OafA/YrhL
MTATVSDAAEVDGSDAPRFRTVGNSFSGRANSIGFFRWLLAFSVIFSHAGPVAGFYGQEDLGIQISDEQSLGGVAVAGFFFFSGFLITRSRARTGMVRYFWRRVLRIMPAFWCALLLTAFVLGPIAWVKEQGSLSGYFGAERDNPLTYVWQNMFLVLDQRNIAGMGTSVPYADIGGFDWNGSAWTLQYEFKAYILVGVLGLVGFAASRWVSTVAAVGILVYNGLLWSGNIVPATWGNPLARLFGDNAVTDALDPMAPFGHPFLSDAFNPMLIAPFAFGMLFAVWGRYIPVSDVLAVVGIVAAYLAYDFGGWNVWGQYGLLYFLMWAAIRWTRLQHWEKYGDFSYGVYIFAWPLMMFACYFGLEQAGMLAYFAVIVVVTHVIAFASWHLIEKPAMSLKDWVPPSLIRRRGAGPDPVPADDPRPVPALAGAGTES